MIKHYNATKVYEDIIFSGTKSGEIVIFDFNTLDKIDEKKVCDGTIMAIDVKNGIFSALSQSYDVIIGEVSLNRIKVLHKFNGLNYIIEDGYQVGRSESQGITLNPNGTMVAFRSPNSTCMIIDLLDLNKKIENIRFEIPYDITTLCWTKNKNILVGFNNGNIGKINIKTKASELIQINGVDENIHWFESINDYEYIVATDSRCLIRIDENTLNYKVGERFANDDFEHVTYDKVNNIAYGTSFDRNIYMIDIDTLEKIDVIYKSEFKIRWSDIIYKNGFSYLLFQVRNGTIVKLNLSTKTLEGRIKEIPPAFWTYVNYNGEMLFFGDDGGIKYLPDSMRKDIYHPIINKEFKGYYIKRAISDDNLLVLGGTNGKILIKNNVNNIDIINIGTPVRDLCFGINCIYVASESGKVYKIENSELMCVYKNNHEPVWSISFNSYLNVLAIGERRESVKILDVKKDYNVMIYTDSTIPKRMKWISENKLLVVNSSNIDLIKYDKELESWDHIAEFYRGEENTVEDFILYKNDMIIGINYNRYIQAWHLETGEILGRICWDQDYAKGIMNIDEDRFIVYGRNSRIKEYIMHDHEILLTKIIN